MRGTAWSLRWWISPIFPPVGWSIHLWTWCTYRILEDSSVGRVLSWPRLRCFLLCFCLCSLSNFIHNVDRCWPYVFGLASVMWAIISLHNSLYGKTSTDGTPDWKKKRWPCTQGSVPELPSAVDAEMLLQLTTISELSKRLKVSIIYSTLVSVPLPFC